MEKERLRKESKTDIVILVRRYRSPIGRKKRGDIGQSMTYK